MNNSYENYSGFTAMNSQELEATNGGFVVSGPITAMIAAGAAIAIIVGIATTSKR
ncbi:MAG: hypothetical protein Ta2B_08590 [Termitinemataceae bacterium]|nr:MAG: hypothetical protein Ta2B_08590 [Termitinemataceae bacterium]